MGTAKPSKILQSLISSKSMHGGLLITQSPYCQDLQHEKAVTVKPKIIKTKKINYDSRNNDKKTTVNDDSIESPNHMTTLPAVIRESQTRGDPAVESIAAIPLLDSTDQSTFNENETDHRMLETSGPVLSSTAGEELKKSLTKMLQNRELNQARARKMSQIASTGTPKVSLHSGAAKSRRASQIKPSKPMSYCSSMKNLQTDGTCASTIFF